MTAGDTVTGWREAHDAYLEAQLDRLRLLARRRIRWLRSVRWRTDPLDDHGSTPEARSDRVLGEAAHEPGTAALAGDAPADDLTEALDASQRRLRAYEDELIELGAPPALNVLQHITGMSDVERDAVLVALAPELDHSFRALYAYLHDDPALRFATTGLVADLTARPLPEVWDLLRSDVPSRRYQVFTGGDQAGTARPLLLDARLVTFLRGDNRVDERLRHVVDALPDLPLVPRQRQLVDRLARWLSDPQRVARHRVINLLGAAGQGREAVAAGLARELGLTPLRLDPEQLARAGEAGHTRLVDRETMLLPAALYADAPEETVADPAITAAASRVLDEVSGLLMIGSRSRRLGRQPTLVIEVPVASPKERLRLLEDALQHSSVGTGELAELVEQFTLGPEAVVRVTDEARALAELHSGSAGTPPGRGELWAACRTNVGSELGDLATRVTPAFSWDDLVLPQRERELLHAIAAQVACRPRVYGTWGFARKLPRGSGVTALFAGPSGTGKTMAAEVIAGALNLDLHRIDLSAVVSKYIGETEKNLRRVFDAAERGGAVLFFDEADALFGKRTEVTDSHDRHANVEINYLLQRMEDYAGLAILATNRKADLDTAFLRRIRFVVTFPFPDTGLRRRLWQGIWPAETPLDGLDHDALAALEITGGSIRTIAVNAAFLAADADQPVGMPHVLRAARQEYDKLDRRPTRSEFGDLYPETAR